MVTPAASMAATNQLPILLLEQVMGYAKVWSLQGEHFAKFF